LLLILTGICVVMMAITFFTDYSPATMNKVVGYVVVPFQNGVIILCSLLS